MSRCPIRETPSISGEDARRFDEAMRNSQPISPERRQELRESYEILKSIATFPLS